MLDIIRLDSEEPYETDEYMFFTDFTYLDPIRMIARDKASRVLQGYGFELKEMAASHRGNPWNPVDVYLVARSWPSTPPNQEAFIEVLKTWRYRDCVPVIYNYSDKADEHYRNHWVHVVFTNDPKRYEKQH